MTRDVPLPPYVARITYTPARDPHVGPDSPDYLKVIPARLVSLRILRDWIDVTDELDPAELAFLERRATGVAGLPRPLGGGVQPPSPPSSFSHGGQGWIDWR